jgi:flagellar motor switch protein FliM
MDQVSPPLPQEDGIAPETTPPAANPPPEAATKGGIQKTGLDQILTSAMVAYERLPMLEVVFDRFVRVVSTSLRNFTSDNVEVSLEKIQTLRFGDYLDAIPLPAMISVFKAEEWDDCGLLTVSTPLIYSIVDVLLGGRRTPHEDSPQGRPYTTIERNLVERMIHIILSDLSASFDPISAVTFRFERLEINPRFATIAKAANASVLITIKVEMEERGGTFDILIPLSTLEPVREILLQMFMGEKFGRDSIWETHLAGELWFTEVSIEAVLGRKNMNLNEVLHWEVGSFIDLEVPPDPQVELVCGGMPLFYGKLGQKNRNMAIQLDSRINKEKNK